MKKLLVVIITILGINSLRGTSLSSDLQVISSSLSNLATINQTLKQEPIIPNIPNPDKTRNLNKKLYKNLYKALSEQTFKDMITALNNLPQWPTTIAITDVIELLRKDSNSPTSDPLFIRYKTLELKAVSKLEFVHNLLFLGKIIETIMTRHSPTEKISIFSDDILNEPLFIYLLLSALHKLEYKSIDLNILSTTQSNFDNLRGILKEEKPELEFTIKSFEKIDDLINSDNKMDIYLTNLTYPSKSTGFICSWADAQIFAEHSVQEASNYLVSSKQIEPASQKKIAFKNLAKFLIEPSTMNSKACELLKTTHTDLADIIYSTNKSSGKKVPLFVYTTKVIDTKAGINKLITIIESRLNFTKYSDLFSALFKTRLATESKDFSKQAQGFELFTQDKADSNKFVLLSDDLDKTSSTITEFIRRKTLVGPSVTHVAD